MCSIKILFLTIASFAILNNSCAMGEKLKCEFKMKTGYAVGNIYTCFVKDNGIFGSSRVAIDSIEGRHITAYSNEDVKGINIDSISNVNFIPSNIEKHFENLIAIRIGSSELRKVDPNDTAPFPNLIVFDLYNNEIKTIEKDTFKFNPLLKGIYLCHNQISHIDREVFSELSHLEKLYLSDNNCKESLGNADTRSETIDIIQEVERGDCSLFDPKQDINQNMPNENNNTGDDSSNSCCCKIIYNLKFLLILIIFILI